MASEFDVSDFQRGVAEGGRRYLEVVANGVEIFTRVQLLGDAQSMAPVGGGSHSPYDPHPGFLAGDSATAEQPVIGEDSIGIMYGMNAVYAAVQNETEEFGHDQGQWHFLTDAIEHGTPRLMPFLGSHVKGSGF